MKVISSCEKKPQDLPGCVCERPRNDHEVHRCACDFTWRDPE